MRYKIINVAQGSEAWLTWRRTVITATDCPCIMGSNPWKTQYKCWQLKKGLIEEDKANSAMLEGIRREPAARFRFIKDTGINMTPVVVESTESNFLGASLDGISDCGRSILEIKCGGEKLHSMAAHGVIPDYYIDQMQHQLLVTGAEKCYYYSFDGLEGICIEVYPDGDFVEKFMPKARAFWRCIAFDEAPPLSLADYKDMNASLTWQEYAHKYQEVDAAIKKLEDEKESLRKMIIAQCGDMSCQGSGIKVMKSTIRGRIAYDEIPELAAIDLEKYRKEKTYSWKIMVDRPNNHRDRG